MKKSDLKNGYVVDLRVNGYRRVVLFDELLIDENGRYERASNLIQKYRNDLTHRCDPNLDIMKVYNEEMDLIWEREEIDWSKVPVGTKVLVSANEKDWFTSYFIKKLSPIEDANFYVINLKGELYQWDYCKLAEESKEKVSYKELLDEFNNYCDKYYNKNNSCVGCECYDGTNICRKEKIIDNRFTITRK